MGWLSNLSTPKMGSLMCSSITIVTPTFQAANTLKYCLNSVAAQSVGVEHILIDGGSADGTLDIIRHNGKHLAQVVSEPDQGVYDAMNKGIKLATGDIIGILNADDFYPSSDVLSLVLDAFSDPAIDACYGDLCYVDSQDITRVVRYWVSGKYVLGKFYHGWMPPHPTFFVRRSVYERFGLFNLKMGSAADYEIMLRFLLKYKVHAVYIPHTLVHMRTGGVSNASLMNRLRANRMDREAWRVNDLQPRPWTLAMKPLRKLRQWFVQPNEI